jgi:hypothetical protein
LGTEPNFGLEAASPVNGIKITGTPDNAAQNLAILRPIALHQLKPDTRTRTRTSLKNRRLKASSINDSYHARILGW